MLLATRLVLESVWVLNAEAVIHALSVNRALNRRVSRAPSPTTPRQLMVMLRKVVIRITTAAMPSLLYPFLMDLNQMLPHPW